MSEYYQIEKVNSNIIISGKTVIVRRHLDGTTSAWYEDHALVITALEKKPKALSKQKESVVPMSASAAGKIAKRSFPWGKFNPHFLPKPTH